MAQNDHGYDTCGRIKFEIGGDIPTYNHCRHLSHCTAMKKLRAFLLGRNTRKEKGRQRVFRDPTARTLTNIQDIIDDVQCDGPIFV